jgi:prepilin-type N-terminal cleavage/methylation domain-containing protein
MSRAKQGRGQAGFTLVELMITVAIVGILAALGFPALIQYIRQSRTVEATGFLAEVKARQESYRFDFGRYFSVSSARDDWFPSNPVKGGNVVEWTAASMGTGDGVSWTALGAMPSGGKSRFVYSTVADIPGTVPAFPADANTDGDPTRGYTGNDFWFITSATSDLDDDGKFMIFESYSHSPGIWSSVGPGID